jgi:hypothetical protein
MSVGRIRPPARENIADSELGAYDAIMARVAARGYSEPSPYLAALLTTPTIGAAINEVGRAIRLGPAGSASYSHRDFELVVHALGVQAGVIEPHHILDALAQGVSAETLEKLLHGRDGELDEEEATLVDFARRIVAGTISDESWAAAVRLRGERGAVELAIVAGFVWVTMRWQLAWGVTRATVDEADAMLRAHRAGTLALPDQRTAVRA